jgi:hypothetical protein
VLGLNIYWDCQVLHAETAAVKRQISIKQTLSFPILPPASVAARLCGLIQSHQFLAGDQVGHPQFDSLALELFSLQFNNNAAYYKICVARKRTPQTVNHWTQIPAVPTAAFKALEFSCISPAARTAVFHSSGTTEQKPSRTGFCLSHPDPGNGSGFRPLVNSF